jgi:hypothetical protein
MYVDIGIRHFGDPRGLETIDPDLVDYYVAHWIKQKELERVRRN